MRTILSVTLLTAAFTISAQNDTSPMKVVKSAPVEMKTTGNVQSTTVSSTTALPATLITGDFTVCSAHPGCAKGTTTAERTKCTAEEVRRHLLGRPRTDRPKTLDVITVEFDVDEYGMVKSIRSNTGSEPALGQSLIVALSSLPKFEAARQGEVRAASHCSFSYTVDDLFPAAPDTLAAPVATGTSDTIVAPMHPAHMSIRSGDHMITGAFTTPSMHPACAKGKPGQKTGSSAEDQVRCTADEVLGQIRSKLKAAAPAYLDVVVVDFDIDEYGDVRSIRANSSSEPELGKAVIVALYGLPKFIPAKKDGARARSHCTFQYPVDVLFAKP